MSSYMMYHKALLFNDPTTALEILRAPNPRKAKALGRKVANFNEKVWLAHRSPIVEAGTHAKFTRAAVPDEAALHRGSGSGSDGAAARRVGPGGLRAALLETGDRLLVEASPFDPIWGVGFAAADAERNREHWGLNLLGKALMAVRARFREEEAAEEQARAAREEEERVVEA